jgi:hypothetical protein
MSGEAKSMQDKYNELMRMTESYIKRLHEEEGRGKTLLGMVHELEAELSRTKESLDNSRAWYAVRWERLKNLLRDTEYHRPACSIMANGTSDHFDPPTYEQQLNILKANLAECKKELKAKEELLENFMLGSGKIH